MKPTRRVFSLAAALGAAIWLAGCAAMNTVTSEVSTYGSWPAERKPGSYAFERLPSQQANVERQTRLEDAARGALEKAGFRPAADAARADVLVQIGARVSRIDASPWDDPLWWRWGAGYWRGPGWRSSGFGLHFNYSVRYDRDVALLIRDRASGTPIYEARASNDGSTAGDAALLGAMFEAALKDFPTPALNPRRVSVGL